MVRRADFCGGLFWLLLGAWLTWQGYRLDIGELHSPGSGFLLFWLGLIMMGLAAPVIAQAFISEGASVADLWANTRWGKVAIVIAVMLTYALLFETIGFVAGGFALVLVLMLFIDPVRLAVALPVSALAVLGTWAALTKWLKIQIPAGMLAGWLG